MLNEVAIFHESNIAVDCSQIRSGSVHPVESSTPGEEAFWFNPQLLRMDSAREQEVVPTTNLLRSPDHGARGL